MAFTATFAADLSKFEQSLRETTAQLKVFDELYAHKDRSLWDVLARATTKVLGKL